MIRLNGLVRLGSVAALLVLSFTAPVAFDGDSKPETIESIDKQELDRYLDAEDPVTVDQNGLRSDAAVIGPHLDVPVDEMEKYLELQIELLELVPEIEATLGNQLAGVWLEWSPAPTLQVHIVGEPLEGALQRIIGEHAESVEIHQGAQYSHDELVSLIEGIGEELELHIGPNFTSYIDEPARQFVFEIDTEVFEQAEAYLRELELEGVEVVYISTEDLGARVNRGGRHLVTCTSGFTVKKSSLRGYLTAGHCEGNQNYKWWSDGVYRQAHFMAESLDASRDVEWHRVDPSVQGVAALFHVSVSTARPQESALNVGLGSFVCMWGTRSMTYSCGSVVSTTYNAPECGPNENLVPCSNSWYRVRLTSGKICEGDSGGPVFVGNRPVGLITGSTSLQAPVWPETLKCTYTYGERYMWFMPIQRGLVALGTPLLP